ncbi:hypothetical protein [Candidatus Marimicrobium litorale]|uniref:Uncharacterized protein n=1 Tax=Candidatus Marimicrobium litorale TaxID=2518991 RepID=A0ABT3T395_9GAMM|nr:hypothetical protein [Candidatus Marimicrobium litorale]MCX2976718.1 hypothetical protein [Candidatus Marimicrobium litorale]
MKNLAIKAYVSSPHLLGCLGLTCALLIAGPLAAQSAGADDDLSAILQQLTDEKELLTSELEQFHKTLALLQSSNTPVGDDSNPAVRSLTEEAAVLKERLITITEKEVSLLQRQLSTYRSESTVAVTEQVQRDRAMESKPLSIQKARYNEAQEANSVDRLQGLLGSYYTELEETSNIAPTDIEIEAREIAQREADALKRIPYSASKVRLTGAEASASLAEISQRLMDNRIPESRRDIAPIFAIRTHFFDTLIVSENRSLRPVGKNHYIARLRIQPGDTTLTVFSDEWTLRLPQHANARDFLITLHKPLGGKPELHVFAVDDLLTLEHAHLPAWLPDELDIPKNAG